MSIYLGDTKVGASFHRDRYNEITPEQMEEFNDAVNYRTGQFDTNSIPEMIEELKQKYMVSARVKLHINENPAPWVRPQGWPDLDSLNLQMEGDTDFIYMTYDATRTYGAVNLYITGSNIEVTMGHISSGAYVIDETISGTNNIYTKSLDGLGGYPIIRVTGNITMCHFREITRDGRTQAIQQQPVLERVAYVPHAIDLSGSANGEWGSYYLQREKINNGDGAALTYLGYAYHNCYSLKEIDISGLKTQNVTDMRYMFNWCSNLNQALDLRHFNVTKVKNVNRMFCFCYLVTEINLTGWNLIPNQISEMFNYCFSLKHIYGIETFDISNCTTLSALFSNCSNLQELPDLSNWDTSNITNLNSVFSGCNSLQNIDFISSWNITNKVTRINNIFTNCYNLEKLDLHTWDVSNVTNVSSLFYNCYSLKQLNITGWQINSTTELYAVFSGCISLPFIDISGWHVTNTCTTIYNCFYMCCSLQYLDIPNDWDLSGINSASAINNLFTRCFSLKRITGISNWNLNGSQYLTASSLFSECYSLETLDISGWNVSKITNFNSMFNGCISLKALDVSNWDTSAATTMSYMFYNCRSLTSLDLSNWNTNNVTNLGNIFSNCISLTTVGDISNWNTSKVTTLEAMFCYCYSLNSLPNLNNWNVSKVTTLGYMFRDCYALEEITINNWNLASCTTIQGMFYDCFNLKKLTITNWLLPKLSNVTNLFYYCVSLAAYNGTIPIAINHTYSSCFSLTYESLINIFTNLPTVTTSRTITIYSNALNQLTSAERAIATNKGWTITT